ncbi:MAG: terminase large subunit domain-containing protein [Steroidobacteraceae bacterium]
MRHGEFYDLSVPLFEHYSAGGLWHHNSGKTETLLNCAVIDGLEAPSGLIALYEPTFDLVRLILAPRLEAKLEASGIRYRYNKQENILYTSSRCADFVMRTLDNPARIVGYESYRAHVDELDTLKREHAEAAWRKIIARNRQKPKGTANPRNRVSAYTTPEGFRFCYEQWVQKGKREDGYVLVHAPTCSNPYLESDYEASLRATYPPQLVKAYLDGLFVNLTSGSVYPDFDRRLNHEAVEIRPGEPLAIGMDFNVWKMAAVVFLTREGLPRAVAEFANVRDTPTMAKLIRERYPERAITIYPDASGANTSSKAASVSDISILKDAGFQVKNRAANPLVKDRVASVNALLLNDLGERRFKVNTFACPRFTESLEQQVYDRSGDPDKSSGHDHLNDAAGYFINAAWPIVKPSARVSELRI